MKTDFFGCVFFFFFFFLSFHLMQGNKATKTQWITECVRIRKKRNIIKEQEQ